MEPTMLLFNIVNTTDNRFQFLIEEMTITIDHFCYCDGKHQITNPQAANAQFVCCGKKYIVDNITGVQTIEEWYLGELLPKKQMLYLLMTDIIH